MRISFTKGLLFFSSILLAATPPRDNQLMQKEIENGKPILESTDITIYYSSEGIVLTEIHMAQMLQYENGDKFCPAGMHATCYDKQKKVIGTLRANTVYHHADTDQWELRGDVAVKGFYNDEEQRLNTELLYWHIKTKKIYTDSFVRLETPNELLTGYGFEAIQDLSFYTLTRPQGYVEVDTASLA